MTPGKRVTVVYAIKARETGTRAWRFLTPSGDLSRLRVYAAQIDDREKCARALRAILDDTAENGVPFEAKAVVLGTGRDAHIAPALPTRYVVAVSVYGEDCDAHGWHVNGLVFATREDADAWGVGLMARWTMAKEYRVDAVETDKAVNYPLAGGAA